MRSLWAIAWSGLVLLLVVTACAPPPATGAAAVLLFSGTGASPNDVVAVEALLKSRGLPYDTANSSRLNGMSESQLAAYRLLIVPGGNYIDMGNSLTPETTARTRHAVEAGLNYLGICAGGLLAGRAPSNSFDLTSGVRFGFYTAVAQGIHKAVVPVAGADGPVLEHYWEDGPEFTGWGDVVATYPDGTPAVVQSVVGLGWAVLVGVHPEAPDSWRQGMSFNTPASLDHAYAMRLIEAALTRTPLPIRR